MQLGRLIKILDAAQNLVGSGAEVFVTQEIVEEGVARKYGASINHISAQTAFEAEDDGSIYISLDN